MTDLRNVCMHCNSCVERFDQFGIAFCNRCYSVFIDTTQPVDGVYCPNCGRSGRKYKQGLDGTWHCSGCSQIYSIAKHVAQFGYVRNKENMKVQSKTTPITLSHSQLETWQQCQLRWRLTKIDKVQKAPSEALILGTAFHAALEEDGRRKIVHNMNLQDFQMLDIFDKTMKGVLFADDPNGLITKTRQTAMRAKAQLLILKYIEIVQPTFKPVSVESSFTFAVSDAVKFTGRIDAVTARGIVDWKTAGKPWEVGTQHSKDQAQAYLTALPEQSQVSFAVFSTDGNTASFQSLATQRDEAKAAAYKAKVLDTAEEIDSAKLSGKFTANVGPLCGWCEVLGSCTAGQAWLKLKGRTPQVPVIQAMKAGEGNGE
jgi:putative RecB family exonuclease